MRPGQLSRPREPVRPGRTRELGSASVAVTHARAVLQFRTMSETATRRSVHAFLSPHNFAGSPDLSDQLVKNVELVGFRPCPGPGRRARAFPKSVHARQARGKALGPRPGRAFSESTPARQVLACAASRPRARGCAHARIFRKCPCAPGVPASAPRAPRNPTPKSTARPGSARAQTPPSNADQAAVKFVSGCRRGATPKTNSDQAAVEFVIGCRRGATPKSRTNQTAVEFVIGCRRGATPPTANCLNAERSSTDIDDPNCPNPLTDTALPARAKLRSDI